MISNKINEKNKLRKECIVLRKKIYLNIGNEFNKSLFDNFFKDKITKNLNVVSSFFSVKTEISTIKLNKYLIKKNKILIFPVINEKKNYLIFRQYKENDILKEGKFKIMEPPKKNKILQPDLLFVPCLAFDNKGFRLGYGGGYYDKTFSYYNKINKKFIAIFFAFDDQKLNEIPTENFDIKLDYVITEKKLYNFS